MYECMFNYLGIAHKGLPVFIELLKHICRYCCTAECSVCGLLVLTQQSTLFYRGWICMGNVHVEADLCTSLWAPSCYFLAGTWIFCERGISSASDNVFCDVTALYCPYVCSAGAENV